MLNRIQIVSGGQTGVDRAGLDAAITLDIPIGGWCPRGRLAEDGKVPPHYPLSETETRKYAERTKRNVTDSDATLIITNGSPTGGTALTIRFAQQHNKPFFVIDVNQQIDYSDFKRWFIHYHISVLNIAGPRESTLPGIYQTAKTILLSLFTELIQA